MKIKSDDRYGLNDFIFFKKKGKYYYLLKEKRERNLELWRLVIMIEIVLGNKWR